MEVLDQRYNVREAVSEEEYFYKCVMDGLKRTETNLSIRNDTMRLEQESLSQERNKTWGRRKIKQMGKEHNMDLDLDAQGYHL